MALPPRAPAQPRPTALSAARAPPRPPPPCAAASRGEARTAKPARKAALPPPTGRAGAAAATLAATTSAAAVEPETPRTPTASSLAPPAAPLARLTLAGMAGVAAAGGPNTPSVSSPPAVASTSGDVSSSDEEEEERRRAAPLMATLLVQCPDAKGVVAALAQLLAGLGCNITASDQHTDAEAGAYFQRIRFDYSSMVVGPANTAVLEASIAGTAARFAMDWAVFYDARPKSIAIFVSKTGHCLWDLLIRWAGGDLPNARVVAVIANHPDLEKVASTFEVPFFAVPSSSMGDAAGKAAQEAAIEAVLAETGADLLVLARWMNVFSPAFCAAHAAHTINIHHGFLPAFQGARPYHQAHARGVKVIGSSAHFATARLDEGPLIEQVRRWRKKRKEKKEKMGEGTEEGRHSRRTRARSHAHMHTHAQTHAPSPSHLPLRTSSASRTGTRRPTWCGKGGTSSAWSLRARCGQSWRTEFSSTRAGRSCLMNECMSELLWVERLGVVSGKRETERERERERERENERERERREREWGVSQVPSDLLLFLLSLPLSDSAPQCPPSRPTQSPPAPP